MLVTLPRLGLEVCGWVPQAVIDIGTTRRYGDVVLTTDLPDIIDAGDIESFDIPQSHLFGKTIAAYMIGLKNAQEDLHMLPRWVGPFINNEGACTKAVDCIVAGTEKAGLLESFNYFNVTIDNIISRGSHITKETKENFKMVSLIYVIFLKFSRREPEVYIGKTGDGAVRFDGHMLSKKDGTTAKDEAHRESSEMFMIPVCILDDDAEDDHLRLIAEQYFVNLFGCYFEKILVFHDDEELATFQQGSSAPGQHVQNTAEAKVGFISRWYNDCMHAYLFNKFAASVFEKVGWTPLCQRRSFGAPRGLNWQSPLGAEPQEEKTIWTAIESEALKVTNYIRSSRTAQAHGGAARGNPTLKILTINGPQGKLFTLNVPAKDPGPSLGDPVFVCFEVMHGGKPHLIPWARLPQVCRFPDVDLANSLAVKITWSDKEGKFWERYVQHNGDLNIRDDSIPGSLSNYGTATGLIRFLQRKRLANEEGFDSDLGLARVKELKYDHLKQLIDIRDRDFATEQGMSNEVTKQAMRSMREVGNMLHDLGADNIGGDWQVFKEGNGRENGRRMACDSCYVLAIGYYKSGFNAGGFICNQIATGEGEPPHCQTCKALGRPCSWTFTAKLGPDTELFKALCPPPLDSSAIEEVEDPVLRNITLTTAEEERDQVQVPADNPGPSAGRARGRGRGRGGRGSRGGRGGSRGGAGTYESRVQRGQRLMAEQPDLAGTVEEVGQISD